MNRKNLVTATVATVLTLGVASAAAAETTGIAAQINKAPVMPVGKAFALGGGVTGYAHEGTREYLGTGGYWEARFIMGTQSILGGEIAYVGSGREIAASGLDSRALLVSNGIETNSRISLPLRVGELRLSPFLMSGIGYQHLRVTRSDVYKSEVKKSANALVMPFGAGLGVGHGPWLVDFRFTYRRIFDSDLIKESGHKRENLGNWALGLTAGYQI